MKRIKILSLFLISSLIVNGQNAKSTLVFFKSKINIIYNEVTIITIDEANSRVLYGGNFRYFISEKEFEAYKVNGFDSLKSLKQLIDSSQFDTFIYSKSKITLKGKQYVYYKKGKIYKIALTAHYNLLPDEYEEEYYFKYTGVDKYYMGLIRFDLYDLYKYKFRILNLTKPNKYTTLKNLAHYNSSYRYKFINYVLPFFALESFVGEKELQYSQCYEIGNFLESYYYIEKVITGK